MNRLSFQKQKTLITICFLFFPLLFLLTFTYYPAFKLFQLSFSDWNGMSPQINIIGFSNYKEIFRDGSAFMYLQNNLAYILMMLLQTALGLYFAIILDTNIKGRNFFKSMIFMPYIMNGVAIAFMFSFMYDFEQGPINSILNKMGLAQYAVHWLGDNYFINFSLAFIVLWRYLGFDMVIFLGALQSIPKSLYESSSLDGANFFQNIRYITLPSIKPVITLLLFIGLNGSLQIFFEPFVITGGGPAGRSETFVTKAYAYAFTFQNFGLASALGVLLLCFVVFILVIQNIVISRKENGGGNGFE